MTDTWMYQGRQQHMWFGHGTKPKDVDGKEASATSTPPASLEERVAMLGHTLMAGLPASRRSHAVARLDADDRGRLGRVMTGTVRALPLGPRLTALRVFGTHPDAPGMVDVVRSGRLLKEASTAEGMRAATDALAQGAMAMGLDQFRPFLRRADDHLTATGGEAALARDVAVAAAPGLQAPEPPAPAPVVVVKEPEHGRIWWWLHDHGLAQTRHEKAELLRRAMGVESGGVYYRNGVRLDIEQMSDDEIIALDQEMRSSRPAPLPAGVAGATDSSWGWRNSPPYKQALKELEQPGTHETLNGRVPTEEEAKRMIAEIGGRIERIEDGHGPNSKSSHNQRHINYEIRINGRKTKRTVYVRQ